MKREIIYTAGDLVDDGLFIAPTEVGAVELCPMSMKEFFDQGWDVVLANIAKATYPPYTVDKETK